MESLLNDWLDCNATGSLWETQTTDSDSESKSVGAAAATAVAVEKQLRTLIVALLSDTAAAQEAGVAAFLQWAGVTFAWASQRDTSPSRTQTLDSGQQRGSNSDFPVSHGGFGSASE